MNTVDLNDRSLTSPEGLHAKTELGCMQTAFQESHVRMIKQGKQRAK